MNKHVIAAVIGSVVLSVGPIANATTYTEVDLSNYVNLGFTNSWFINGSEFSPIIGATTGNQGSSVPFSVANSPDTSGQGGYNNFWFGLWGGPSNQLTGSPLSVTIPITTSNVRSVYVLGDNTFGLAGNTEFSVTFTGSGGSITDLYVGANNTKDYNLNCTTTGCDATPNAQYWFVDADAAQWLQISGWDLPANFGLSSITFNQVDAGDGAIIAGVTLSDSLVPTPLPSTWGMMLIGLAGFGFIGHRRQKRTTASRTHLAAA
ncbi:MAG: PEP-CTERM sorting domain-containing protein [Hyphomicrobiales bacterium]|nr:PEP-CTERM sorting domain-containing protein [Hyphomicrobiales bacterium]